MTLLDKAWKASFAAFCRDSRIFASPKSSIRAFSSSNFPDTCRSITIKFTMFDKISITVSTTYTDNLPKGLTRTCCQ